MADLARSEIIALLDQLGAIEDDVVVAAARSLHRKVTDSGRSWEALLRLDAEPVPAPPANPDAGETERTIECIRRKDISAELRADLDEMLLRLREGNLDAEDRKYVHALGQRLGV